MHAPTTKMAARTGTTAAVLLVVVAAVAAVASATTLVLCTFSLGLHARIEGGQGN